MSTFLAIILLAILVWLVPLYYRRWRRQHLRRKPLTAEQQELLIGALPLYRHLSPEQQRELQANVALFLHDKEFVGCDGLRVTEPMRLAVAGFACLLLLGRENHCYPNLYTVLMYPDTYVARETHVENYVESTEHSAREGEAHYRGPVVLSWADLQQDMAHPENGRNVALHEFAHKLDEEDGYYDGRPLFADAGEGSNWAAVMGREFERLRRKAGAEPDGGNEPLAGEAPSILDIYGAQSPAEFFAVATETFFVIPTGMKTFHPQLYGELCAFYRLDPHTLLRGNPPGDRYPT
ncbi:zinc-dependent peptidase [Microbulbifer litoralis]|uniref:M90 family metallopeptidase n=1 Tax=Microbulbifer litoralis TaxID=2933965 RepID=UPI0020287068|nr:M90 family metallopeptidase [Microbulbifer sp. GX H0434]